MNLETENINESENEQLIEWQFISLKGHYAYWVVKNNKTKFEKQEMAANKKTMFLKKGVNPNKTIEWIREFL